MRLSVTLEQPRWKASAARQQKLKARCVNLGRLWKPSIQTAIVERTVLVLDIIKLFESKLEERRGEERFEMTLPGRYRRDDGQLYPCWTIDVSLSGVAIRGFGGGRVGERTVADIRQIGRVEGVIARSLNDGLAVEILAPAAERGQLALQIARLAAGAKIIPA
jgi:PilZ domain